MYLPDEAEVHFRREVVGTCGYVLTMDGYNQLQRDQIYIDLTYRDTVPPGCMPSKPSAEALLKAKMQECESDEGSKFFGEVKQKDDRWCISARCEACDSKWRDNIVEKAKQKCCDSESEPEPGRGVCLDPRENPDTGTNGSALYLLPKCTDKAPDYESGSYCEPPGSSSSDWQSSSSDVYSSSNAPSSSSDERSSSSEQPPSSSSSLIACFRDGDEAKRVKREKELDCLTEQGSPRFGIDGDNCLWGQCDKPSSSSSAPSSSSAAPSSSSLETGNACAVSEFSSLRKPVNYRDDWVYMGKEAYGSRHVTSRAINPGSKFFDVLGRVYGKMKAKLQYYVSKDAVKKDERDVSLEFDVWARIIKDSEGNDIQVFIKEDKARGLRRDSSFYYDGRWEVMEMRSKTEIILRNSSGITTSSIRDSDGKLQESSLADKDGNLIVHDKYIWKDGLLVKMITLDGVRTYHYGKNPYEDTVRVVPSDEGYLFHSGYDGTAGMIPRKGDANYESYLANPYGVRVIENYGIVEKEFKLNALMKGGYNIAIPLPQMPIPDYINVPWADTLKPECIINKKCLPIMYSKC